MTPRDNPTKIWHLFRRSDLKKIERAVGEAERRTAAEIRVALIHSRKQSDIRDEAVEQFQKLGMHRTAERSGVLILLAAKEKEFIVFADEGINRLVDEGAWETVKAGMEARFRDGEFLDGILDGISGAAELLSEHFPWHEGVENELPDEVALDDTCE